MPAHAPTSRGLLVPVMLATSLACNVLALFIPFVGLDVALKSETTYSLLTSVSMLWDAGLRSLALLVLAFSVCFPFAKLGILTWVWSGRGSSTARNRWLERIGALGRWSMLDVFLVCILLALTNDRVLIDAAPQLGIPCFVAAIVLSMLAGEILHHRAPVHEPPQGGKPPRIGPMILLVLAGIALATAQVVPLLHVRSMWMANGDFSLVQLVPALFGAGSPVLGALVAIGLIIVPWLVLISTWRIALRSTPSIQRRHGIWKRWSMLDVFLLALLIFVLEGKSFVPSETRGGVYLMIISLILSTCAIRLVQHWARPSASAAT